MAYLYKRPNSPYWWVSYSEGGKEIRNSTGIRHEGRVKPRPQGHESTILRTLEERLASKRFGMPVLPDDVGILDWYEAFAKWYVVEHTPKASTWTFQQRAAQAFLKWAKANKVTMLSHVTPSKLREYFTGRQIASKTRKNEVSWWRQVWERAKLENKVHFDANPWAEFSPRKVVSVPRRAFTQAEIDILLALESPLWRVFLVWVGYFTGERYSAILHLRVDDLMGDVLRFSRTKEDRIRYVYCPQPLKSFLKEFTAAGETWLPAEIIDREKDGEGRSFPKLFAGLRKKHKGLFQGVSFHSLRHTYSSLLANSGIAQKDRMEIMDHSTVAAHSRYVHEESRKALTYKVQIEAAFTHSPHT